ncbi:MAG: hypothetical protein J7J22_02810 [Candidatus Verstraetearchaeota archaeon]|nr:hypothetical protein [Candidatus Verstraetearchaeota archaeon]
MMDSDRQIVAHFTKAGEGLPPVWIGLVAGISIAIVAGLLALRKSR